MPATAIAEHAANILRLLAEEQNVLLSGAPGTGKSRVLNEVARLFAEPAGPVVDPGGAVPIPRAPAIESWMPSPTKSDRAVFPTVFDPKTKYRDFVRGLVPAPTTAEETGVRFRVSNGTLFRANEHARVAAGASLITIDEINRGPAVQVFGDTIVAIERDKRLDGNGAIVPGRTQQFEVLNDSGEPVLYALSAHLYMVAAMNQADTSVEPLDVAFQRRWAPYRLEPDARVLHRHFGLTPPLGDLPEEAGDSNDVYSAALRAWEAVNRRISLGRGKDFQLGHGVLMRNGAAPPAGSVPDALRYVRRGWERIRAHVDEVFFGDSRGIAAALNIGGNDGHPYTLERSVFGDQRVLVVRETQVTDTGLYRLLRAVATEG